MAWSNGLVGDLFLTNWKRMLLKVHVEGKRDVNNHTRTVGHTHRLFPHLGGISWPTAACLHLQASDDGLHLVDRHLGTGHLATL